MKKLKTIISSIVIGCLAFAFMRVVVFNMTNDFADKILTTFLTLGNTVISSYIGYQTGKEKTENGK